MAVQSYKTNVAPINPFNNGAQQRQPADGFINLWLPTKGGSRRKVGSVALYRNNTNTAQLIDWLNQSEANLEKFVKMLIVDYNPNTVREENEFDLD